MASLAERLSNAPATLRWHAGRALTRAIYSSAFGAIGAGSVIVAPLRLAGLERIQIGRDVTVFEGAWLATECDGTLAIGDNTYIGHDVHLHAIDPVSIGRGCVIADGVFVASSDHDRCDRHGVHGTGPIVIEDDVFLGQRAIVLGGVTIGAGATVGAGAVVTCDVPAGATVAGVPARSI